MRVGYEAKRVFHNNTGLGNYSRDVIRILSTYTPIAHFFLYNTKPSSVERIAPSEKIHIQYPKGKIWKKFSSVWRLGPVITQIKEDKIDLYHGLSGEIPRGLKKNGIPTIVTIHDLIFFTHPQYYSVVDREIYAKKFRHAAQASDCIIAISEQTKRDIVQYLQVPESKITVVYQGCNDAFKKSYTTEEKSVVKEKFKLPDQFVLNVGTIEERKNALTLIKAIKGTPYKVVLIGSQKKYAEQIHTYIKEHQLEAQVQFLKNVALHELAIIYQLATVFCYPSHCEGFGIPIIEALFSKTPVITSKGNCFPEAGGPNSIYIEPQDSETLKEELEALFNSEELRAQISKDGFAYVQKFSDENVAKHLYTVYKSVTA